MTDEELTARYIEWADPLIRLPVPFLPKGRSRDGVDCYGLVWLGKREVEGVELPSHVAEYDNQDIKKNKPHISKMLVREAALWDKVESGQEKPGDVILMSIAGVPLHVGLIIERGLMLHIEERIEICTENYNVTRHNRIIGIYRNR